MAKKMSAKAKGGITIGVIVVIVALIVLITSIVFQDKEEYITTEYQQNTMNAVVCKASDPKDGFFAMEEDEKTGVQNATSMIKATYQNDTLDKLTYSYEGKYESKEAAEQAEAKMHALYNQYMTNLADKLSPKFSTYDNTMKISLFGSWGDLTAGMAKVFGLTDEDYDALSEKNKPEELSKLFQGKGYLCEVEK